MKKLTALVLVMVLMIALCACGVESTGHDDAPLSERAASTPLTEGSVGATATTAATEAGTTDGTAAASAAGTAATAAPTAGDTPSATGGVTPVQPDGPAVTTAEGTSADLPSTTSTTTTITTTTSTTTTTTTTTRPTAALRPGDIAGQTLRVGDRMYDITLTDTEGTAVTLSALLQEKELVVLNFWFVSCPWCVREFPAMSAAYSAYADRVAVYAVNPIDSIAKMRAFRAQNPDLQFPMAPFPYAWAQAFGVEKYPTSVVIDRNGVVREIHVGAILDNADWVDLFETYL